MPLPRWAAAGGNPTQTASPHPLPSPPPAQHPPSTMSDDSQPADTIIINDDDDDGSCGGGGSGGARASGDRTSRKREHHPTDKGGTVDGQSDPDADEPQRKRPRGSGDPVPGVTVEILDEYNDGSRCGVVKSTLPKIVGRFPSRVFSKVPSMTIPGHVIDDERAAQLTKTMAETLIKEEEIDEILSPHVRDIVRQIVSELGDDQVEGSCYSELKLHEASEVNNPTDPRGTAAIRILGTIRVFHT